MTTQGDVSRAQLTQIGGTGVFVSALRDALLRRRGRPGRALAQGSADRRRAEGIALAAVPARDDPRDALVARDGSKLGRSAGRARASAPARRGAPPSCCCCAWTSRCVPIRGNADTRLRQGRRRASSTRWCSPRRACAASAARTWSAEIFEPDDMLPAPGQGALAVECRAADTELAELLAAIDDPASRAAVTAERAVLAALEAGCSAPVGAYAAGTADDLQLEAAAIAVDGGSALRER